ncbi:hypothetical protein SAMN05216266_11956 [Amycolatopsis marina]|uniref:DUF5919 domain-containing protein n=1 Tax=Amycolatopsis marina TaxID=490629 RepID=A0A1I1BZF1_9PSEU|nr:DUF5919 domain-containing protein [Amycolatopsis marina]SFB55795.1 hypothetical protein SAMN05216266_11956 [Amycolatopsis marina]
MSHKQGRVRSLVQATIKDENLDLYILALVAAAFTVLGVTGLSDAKTLSSVVLGLLALLALSQIKSRKVTQQIRETQGAGSRTFLRREFPADLITRRANASDILLAGRTMSRTVQGMRHDLPPILKNGGRVRIVVLDPTNESLMATANRQISHSLGAEHLRQRIHAILDDLTNMRDRVGGRLEIRVVSSIPSAGFNCLEPAKPNGIVCVQHYEFEPDGEASPILALTRDDDPWYSHFLAEAERLWHAGSDWPPAVQPQAVP